jgi:hypothetical protein
MRLPAAVSAPHNYHRRDQEDDHHRHDADRPIGCGDGVASSARHWRRARAETEEAAAMNCHDCGHRSRVHVALEDSIARLASPFGMGCPECNCMAERPPTGFFDRVIMSWGIVANFHLLVRLHPKHDVRDLGHEVRAAVRRIWRQPP